MNNDKRAFEAFQKQSMNKLGKFLWKTGTIKWYRDGTFFSPSFNWWHPLTWGYVMTYLIMLVPACAFTSVSVNEAIKQLWEDLTVNEYFKKNPGELRWYKGDKK